jgi:hypothetical protein
VIDLYKEKIVPLAQAAEELPRGREGKRRHPQTLKRWARLGYRGIFLEVIAIGDSLCTSREALQRFAAKVTEAALGDAATAEGRVPANEAVEKELQRRGL